jgi:hypothetical protein
LQGKGKPKGSSNFTLVGILRFLSGDVNLFIFPAVRGEGFDQMDNGRWKDLSSCRASAEAGWNGKHQKEKETHRKGSFNVLSSDRLLTMTQDEDEDSDLTELSAGEESNPPKKTASVKRNKLVHSGLSQVVATGLTLKSDDEA